MRMVLGGVRRRGGAKERRKNEVRRLTGEKKCERREDENGKIIECGMRGSWRLQSDGNGARRSWELWKRKNCKWRRVGSSADEWRNYVGTIKEYKLGDQERKGDRDGQKMKV